MVATQEKQSKKAGGLKISQHAVAAQVCLWTVALALTADVTARIFFEKPAVHPPLVEYQKFFNSESKPDLFVLGSSVALCASYCADAKFQPISEDQKKEYTGAIYLSQQLKEKSGQAIDCRTMACAGSMASDVWMIANKAVEFNKIPKVIVYETVSRDYFDASMPELGDTPVYKTLASLHPTHKNSILPQPVTDLVDWAQRSPLATALNIMFADTRFLTDSERLRFNVDSIASSISYTYKSRTAFKDWLTSNVSHLLNRKASIYESVQALYKKRKENDPFAAFTAMQVDSRPQEKRFDNEIVYFEKLLKLCKQNSINLVLVIMPVGKEYPAKVPPALRKRFPSDITALADKYGVTTLDYSEKGNFNPTDFADFIHLKDTGAVKLTNLITDELSKRPLLSDRKDKTVY